jgi:hypothetical protein
MNIKFWRQASVYCNDDFICIQTNSGYAGISIVDPRGAMHLLEKNVANDELGLALLDALSKTRFVLPAPRQDIWIPPCVTFDLDLYDHRKGDERYRKWMRDLMDRYGYKTKRSMFKNMIRCGVEDGDGFIVIKPTRHIQLEVWEGLEDESFVAIPSSAHSVEVGAALRRAMARCV